MCFPFQTRISNGTSRTVVFSFQPSQQQNPLFQVLFTRVSFIFLVGKFVFFTASKMVLKMKAIFGVGNADGFWGKGSFLPDPPAKACNAVTVRSKAVNIAPCYGKCLPPSSCGPGNPDAWRIAFCPTSCPYGVCPTALVRPEWTLVFQLNSYLGSLCRQ